MAEQIDVTTLHDEELVSLIQKANVEYRQRWLRQLPAQIAGMTEEYVAAGGDRADILSAIQGSQDSETPEG